LTVYPRPYVIWKRRSGQKVRQDLSLEAVVAQTDRVEQVAVPIRAAKNTSTWLTNFPDIVNALQKASGNNPYESFIGVHTYGANGIFFLNKLNETKKLWMVENDTEGIEKPIKTEKFTIEPEVVWPLLRGRDVQAEGYDCKQLILFPYQKDGTLIAEADLKIRY